MGKIRVCTEPNCNNKHYALGLCLKHYATENRLNNKKAGIKEYLNRNILKKNRLVKLKQTNNKCEDCGCKAKDIHHSDHDTSNHNIDNLKALCAKCHVKYRRWRRNPKRIYNDLYELPNREELECILNVVEIVSI